MSQEQEPPFPAPSPSAEGADTGSLRVPLVSEELVAHVAEREQGHVRIRKHVETVPMKADIDITREAVRIDRQPRDEVVEAAKEPWYEGETLVIPRYEERLVTEKRLVLVEEVHVRIRPETEQVHLNDSVRREVVDVEKIPVDPES